MFCSNDPHNDDCSTNEYCARAPDRDGPRFVSVSFELDQRWSPPVELRQTGRKRRKTPRRRTDQQAPLRVGLWSKLRPAASDAAAEGGYALRHEVAHYPQAIVNYGGTVHYHLEVRGAPAAGLIRKLHRADNFGWTDDGTGQSSFLMAIDEDLREQIGLLMQNCGIDPTPAP